MIEKVVAGKNLLKACRQVEKNKGSSGVDRMLVSALRGHLNRGQGANSYQHSEPQLCSSTHPWGGNTKGEWQNPLTWSTNGH